MRSYNCYYYYLIDEKLQLNNNTSCWAGITNGRYYDGEGNGHYADIETRKTIYIDKFTEDLTKKYIKPLVRCINKITPCEIVKLDKEYIKFQLFGTYDQNLVVLNFIRNLWSIDGGLSIEYTKLFFENFMKHRHRDPLKRLTYANIIASKKTLVYDAHHCNGLGRCYAEKAKPKTVKQLLEYKSNSVHHFLKLI